MWPYLFGSGWVWGVMLAAGLAAAAIAAIALTIGAKGAAGDAKTVDPVQALWRRYEQGDLTDWEFARLITPRPAMQPRYAFPAAVPPTRTAGAVPAGAPPAVHDVAAD